MGTFIHILGAGRGRPPDLRHFLHVISSGDPIFWIGDLVDYPQDREDPWRIPPHGDPPSGNNKVEAGYGGTVGITTSGRRNVRCEGIGGGYIFPSPSEHCRPVYCDSSDNGDMYGGRTFSGSTCVTKVVG